MERVMKRSAIALLLFLIPVNVNAVVRNVPGDFGTIQGALNASTSGDEIVVSPGTYAEHLVLNAAQSGIWLHSSGGAAVTTIDGGLSGRVIDCSHVSGGTIEGFTITRGQAGFNTGGGFNYDASNPAIKNCIVRGNIASAGGGIYLNHSSSPDILDCEFADNQAPFGSGGGVYADTGSAPHIERCNIHNNTCAAFGAGLVTGDFCNTTITNNDIHHNTAAIQGGGAWFARTAALFVRNNRFYQNVGPYGGAMWIQGQGITIESNQIYQNTASTNDGGGIYS